MSLFTANCRRNVYLAVSSKICARKATLPRERILAYRLITVLGLCIQNTMFINFVELKKSRKSRANSNSNSKLELDVVGNSTATTCPKLSYIRTAMYGGVPHRIRTYERSFTPNPVWRGAVRCRALRFIALRYVPLYVYRGFNALNCHVPSYTQPYTRMYTPQLLPV